MKLRLRQAKSRPICGSSRAGETADPFQAYITDNGICRSSLEEVGRHMMRLPDAVSPSARPAGQRHLIRRPASLLAALAAAICGAMMLAPAASAGTAAAAAYGALAPHPRIPAAPHVAGAPDLGPNVYVFTPSMPQSQIQATVDAIASQQVPNQFGTQRYALLFEPGSYGTRRRSADLPGRLLHPGRRPRRVAR